LHASKRKIDAERHCHGGCGHIEAGAQRRSAGHWNRGPLRRSIGRVELGLEPPEITLLACTVLVSVVNFTHGRTNRMQGLVHLCLFITYIALIFDVPAGSQG
jgi:hypothetical protein